MEELRHDRIFGQDGSEDAIPPSQSEMSSDAAHVAQALGLPMDSRRPMPLGPRIREIGMDRLCAANGLEPHENQSLFDFTDIETVLDLIWKGVTRRGRFRKD